MKIAIQGHISRGKEVIKILESLGGVNKYPLTGRETTSYYYINYDFYNIINCHDIEYVNKYCKKYTLEEFEKEFPFKIGDIVALRGSNKPHEIIALEFYVNKLCYKLDNGFHFGPRALITYEQTKEKRNVTLTLDKAKEWHKKGGELREIALQAFTEQELNPLPRSWEEYCRKYGYACLSTRYTNISLKYDALLKLEQLRDCWIQGWKPNWLEGNAQKYAIRKWRDKISIETTYVTHSFLSFPTYEMAKEFLECFKYLIEEAGDLI